MRILDALQRSVGSIILSLIFLGGFPSLTFASWTVQSSGTLAWLHVVYFLNENKGWAAGSNGTIVTTEDGGRSWKSWKRPSEDTIRDLFFADENNGWLVCERSIYKLKTIDEPRSYLMKTTNGGESWSRVNVIGKDADLLLLRAVFTKQGHVWTFGEAGALFVSRDGGANWARQHVPTRHLLLGGHFLTESLGWLAGAGSTILQTSDGGVTWRPASIADKKVRFTAVSFVDARHGWAVAAGGRVFVTRDGGLNWQEQKSGVDADLSDVKFIDQREGWATGADGTIIHTIDGGNLWFRDQTGSSHRLERLFMMGRRRGWAVGFGGTILTYDPTGQAS